MDYFDLVDRLVTSPAHTLVIETPKGDLVLVDTARRPVAGDTVLSGDVFTPYQADKPATGVAYCSIHFF